MRHERGAAEGSGARESEVAPWCDEADAPPSAAARRAAAARGAGADSEPPRPSAAPARPNTPYCPTYDFLLTTKMAFEEEEINNLLALLLHQDAANIGLGLAILAHNTPPIDNRILYALNMLSLLLLPQNLSPQQKKLPEIMEKTALMAEIDAQRERYLAAASQLGNSSNFHQDIYIFAVAEETAQQPTYKRWLKKYEQKRRHYEPLFLRNAAWHNNYLGLVRFLYKQEDFWRCINYADMLLKMLPENHNIGMYRYNAVYNLLRKGEAKEEIPQQIRFAQNALKTQHPDSFCMYNVLIANNYYFHYKENERAEEYYREALKYQKGDATFARSTHAALAANNIASIVLAREGDENEAYKLILLANSLVPNSPYYLDSLAYFEWRYKGEAAKAKALFHRVLTLAPAHTSTQAHLMGIYIAEVSHNKAAWAQAKKQLQSLLSKSIEDLAKEAKHVSRAFEAAKNYLSQNKDKDNLLAEVQAILTILNEIEP
jgi:tetratricopeptide (TPR) repeat protein